MPVRPTVIFLILAPLLIVSQARSSDPHTHVSMVADVRHARPGHTFNAGILMSMEKGWHTYWKNPGEAGLPTRITWTLPEGVTAGAIRWPLPHKYNESGEIITYGYADENMLMVPITVAATVPAHGSITLRADVEWLECERVCVPGKASVTLSLPVSSGTPAAAHAALFTRYQSQVPGDTIPPGDLSVVTSTREGTGIVEIELTAHQALAVDETDFYPESIDDISIGRTQVTRNDNGVSLRVPLSAFEALHGQRTLRGVVVYGFHAGERLAGALAINLPASFCGNLSSVDAGETGSVLDGSFTTVSSGVDDTPVVLYVLYALIGGVLLNIMPCVLPVIALKVFGLVTMGGSEPAKVRRHGAFFSLGILASFLALALVVIILKQAGEQVGWGFQFQEPGFVIAMAVVVFAFGLSLFGVYEINLPGVAATGMGSVVAKTSGGYGGSFAEGIFATILATPCTAPVLGTALGFAFSQTAPVILLIFAAVALGMALPYLLLTAKPGWTRFLPKPGAWMVSAKQFMGFLMMATLLWLLYVLGKQLGMEAVIWTAAFLLFVGVACWIIGRFATLTASRVQTWSAWGVSAAVIVAGYMLFLSETLAAHDVLQAPEQVQGTKEGIQWQAFSVDRLDALLAEQRTVFIDFTAEWCLTCKVNEKTVLGDRAITERFAALGIVPLKADWTTRNPEITRLLQKFGRSGVPLYVIFPAGNPRAPIVLPEVITTGIVLDAVNKATGDLSQQRPAL